MVFLFDTICDDIIGEITKYIVWTKDEYWAKRGTILNACGLGWRVQRLLIFPLEKPIITLDAYGYKFYTKGPTHEVINEIMKNKIKINKKGLITYTHSGSRYKQINYEN